MYLNFIISKETLVSIPFESGDSSECRQMGLSWSISVETSIKQNSEDAHIGEAMGAHSATLLLCTSSSSHQDPKHPKTRSNMIGIRTHVANSKMNKTQNNDNSWRIGQVKSSFHSSISNLVDVKINFLLHNIYSIISCHAALR